MEKYSAVILMNRVNFTTKFELESCSLLFFFLGLIKRAKKGHSVASTQSTADDVAERHATNDEFDEEIDQSMNSSIDELSDDELNDI